MGGPGSGGYRGNAGAKRANATRGQTPLAPHKIKAKEIDVQAMRLRITGASFRAIGKQLGVSHENARKRCERAVAELAQQRTDTAEAMRLMESNRLDSMQLAIWKQAMDGDVKAIRELNAIIKSRRELWGLDAPATIDVGVQATTAAQVHFYWPDNGRGPAPKQ